MDHGLGALRVLACALVSIGLVRCVPDLSTIPCVRDANCPTDHVCAEKFCIPGQRKDGGTAAGGGADAGFALGHACIPDAGQCASGYCTDGVCCDLPCDDKPCQRCDSMSVKGAGSCGFEVAGSECAAPTSACSGQCSIAQMTYSCTGAGFVCTGHQELVPVPSGQICASNIAVPVSASVFCNSGHDCAAGKCMATRWWTSCKGDGSCRGSMDSTDAHKETVYAAPGASLSNTCGTSSAACDSVRTCVGDAVSLGHLCDDHGACAAPAMTMNCGSYTCDGATTACKSQCASNADCAAGSVCSSLACHADWEWVRWDLARSGALSENAGIVYDSRSGLMWQQGRSDGGLPWSAAPAYCDALVLGGYSDWRLPTVVELRSVVDFTRTDPAIDDYFFRPVDQNRTSFWSSTPYAAPVSKAWSVDFRNGSSTFDNAYGTAAAMGARCVR